jgi:hypothetical protein
MENDLINTSSIINFIKIVKNADLEQQREIKMSLKEAKTLSYALSLVLARYAGNLENFVVSVQENKKEEIIQITMDGGKGW